ncbi:thiol reductant ABC exporter subunit CydD [Microlunatus sp. Gsoil 973]|uniref:thiol reductant ABC exporter subunit CydD n=1 Tax=Microlunatus sp. Gsoil 973 TaxID=2672569 RepID=UPI0012B47CAC|nr:thiol reductant ABC exporter subunit CydD [Microlunatus sp. Gsoil 973]QGN34605.1 thiol reductant ABC exporter subunit CydD [Microlunatus sp. Gsoil 973]
MAINDLARTAPQPAAGPSPVRGDRPAAARRGPLDPRLIRRASAVRWQLVATSLLGTLTAVSIVAIAWFIAYGVGVAFDRRSVAPIVAAAPWLAAAFVARGGLSWLSDLVAVRTSAAVKSQLRREVAASYLRPDTDQPDRGTVITLITSGLDDLDGYFARYLPQLVLAVTVPSVIGIAIAFEDLLSAVIIALTLPLIPLFMALVGWTTEKITGRRWQVQARLSHHFIDLVAGLPTLRAFGRAKGQAEGLRRSGEANRVETMATLRVALLSALVLELLATLSVAIVAVVIGLRVIAGQVDLQTSLFVLVLAPEAYLPLRKVGVHYHDAAGGAAAARAAFDLIGKHPTATTTSPTAAGRAMPEGPLEILVRDVGYTFPGASAPALERVTLVAPVGDVTVLWGASGSGKSTLLRMLTGWLTPTTGQIMINGTDTRRIDQSELQQAVAWVGQEPALLRGTVADNVRLGLSTATDDQIARALFAAGVDLDPGRRVDEGAGLSAGELRRVALARAWLRIRYGSGRLLLLDEPTAGLDEDNELDAIAMIKDLGVTAVVVSHRPAVLAAADHVVPMRVRS